MVKLENAEIIKNANIYYEGRVTGRTVNCADGYRRTLGFMMAGEYEFMTQAEELIETLGGCMKVQILGQKEAVYREGGTFKVPAESRFNVIVEDYADYCCSYNEQ